MCVCVCVCVCVYNILYIYINNHWIFVLMKNITIKSQLLYFIILYNI